MAKKNKLTNLAKSNKKETNTKSDSMAKKKVEELLSDVDLKINSSKNEELIELDENPKNTEWLQEQVSTLTNQNEKLIAEANEAKENYKKLFQQLESKKNGNVQEGEEVESMIPDSILKNNIVELFIEIQANYLGKNPEKTPYKYIIPPNFVKKMIKMFPFLEEHRMI